MLPATNQPPPISQRHKRATFNSLPIAGKVIGDPIVPNRRGGILPELLLGQLRLGLGRRRRHNLDLGARLDDGRIARHGARLRMGNWCSTLLYTCHMSWTARSLSVHANARIMLLNKLWAVTEGSKWEIFCERLRGLWTVEGK